MLRYALIVSTAQKFLIKAYTAGTNSVHLAVIVFRPLKTKEKKAVTPNTHKNPHIKGGVPLSPANDYQ